MQATGDLPVRSINAPALVTGIDCSDHRSYWQQGYPAVMITDTSFYRNLNYHTDWDLPVTLDYRRMAQVVAGVDCAVRALAKTKAIRAAHAATAPPFWGDRNELDNACASTRTWIERMFD